MDAHSRSQGRSYSLHPGSHLWLHLMMFLVAHSIYCRCGQMNRCTLRDVSSFKDLSLPIDKRWAVGRREEVHGVGQGPCLSLREDCAMVRPVYYY